MSDKLNNLQKKINIKFKNLSYLKKSITHKSYDPLNNYEKLEFLGDRILGFVISKKLIELYPEQKEGSLDKKLASLVNKNQCLEVAKTIGLDKYILDLNLPILGICYGHQILAKKFGGKVKISKTREF